VKVKKKVVLNPHCPVVGCRTKQPHIADTTVMSVVHRFTGPDKCLRWVHASLCELRDSITQDHEHQRFMCLITRLRQVEEVYFRTLYVLFLAPARAIPHVLAGDPPNSFSAIYDEVNDKILKGRGALKGSGIGFGGFSPMAILNAGAHADYKTMQTVDWLHEASEKPFDIEGYKKHINNYIIRIDHIRGLLEAGRDLDTAKQCIINMHTPIEEFARLSQQP
jgi:hypothetical protein